MKTKIITDSCCDLTLEYIKANDIHVIPCTFNIDDHVHEDDFGQSLSYKAFYDEIRKGKMPTTAQIISFTFQDVFKKYLDEGYAVIYLGFSSALSKTLENAIMAKNMILEENEGADITVIDTKSAAIGLGVVVYYSAEMVKAGKSKAEIVDWVEENKLKVNHWFTVDNLDHLKRGGRISATSAAIGTLLDVKPIVSMDNEGCLRVVKKVRGRKKAIKSLVEEIKSNIVNPEEQTIFISHGDCLKEAENLRALILKELKVKDVFMSHVGPIIGTHVGADAVCLSFCGEGRSL